MALTTTRKSKSVVDGRRFRQGNVNIVLYCRNLHEKSQSVIGIHYFSAFFYCAEWHMLFPDAQNDAHVFLSEPSLVSTFCFQICGQRYEIPLWWKISQIEGERFKNFLCQFILLHFEARTTLSLPVLYSRARPNSAFWNRSPFRFDPL